MGKADPAAAKRAQQATRGEIAMIKIACPAMLASVIDWAIQAHGAAEVTTDLSN